MSRAAVAASLDGAALNEAARSGAEWVLAGALPPDWTSRVEDPPVAALAIGGSAVDDPAAVAVRTDALRAAGGAHEGLRAGAVADLLLRLDSSGHAIRRERGPAASGLLSRAAAQSWIGRRHPGRAPTPLARLGAFLSSDAPAPTAAAEVAVLAETFPELSQTFVVNEAGALRRSGCAVRVEARRRAGRRNPDAAAPLPVAYVEDDGRLRKAAATAWLLARFPRAVARDLRARARWRREEVVTPLRALAPVARRLRRSGTRHLHVHFAAEMALDTLRLAGVLGLPYSVTAHAYEIYQQPRNLREKLERAAFATSGCEYTVRDLRALVGEAHRDRIHVIVMGVDASAFRRRADHPRERRVLAVGRLVEKKGFAYLLEAVARMATPPDRVTIVGDGPLRGELEALRERLGLGGVVELAGARAPSRIRDELERAAVLAMPCVVAADGDRDSMPVAVKEALAMEVPVVASDEVGLPELVRPEWGRLVPPRDRDALAAALDELLALPPEERARLGSAGRAFVRRCCDVDAEARKLRTLIDAATAPH